MIRLLKWLCMLNKRLYKKPSFVGLLLMIPVLMISFVASVQQTGGIVTIALAQEDSSDVMAETLITQLITQSRVISFQTTTPEAALELVAAGKADAAWIFPEDTGAHIARYAAGEDSGFIRIVEREETVPLRLAREKLSSAVFFPAAETVYLQYVRQYVPETESVDDRVLLDYLNKTHVNGELFAFYDTNGAPKQESGNFLTAPLRGLLAVFAVITAVVTAMYYRKDLDAGMFSLLPERYGVLTELGYQAVSAANVMLAIVLSLLVTGMYQALWQECLLFVLYGLCCCLFGMVLRRVFYGKNTLPVMLPALIVVLLVICPVFFDLAALRNVQWILPPTYFIQGGYNPRYLLYLAVYDIILCGILLLLEAAGKIKFRKS